MQSLPLSYNYRESGDGVGHHVFFLLRLEKDFKDKSEDRFGALSVIVSIPQVSLSATVYRLECG